MENSCEINKKKEEEFADWFSLPLLYTAHTEPAIQPDSNRSLLEDRDQMKTTAEQGLSPLPFVANKQKIMQQHEKIKALVKFEEFKKQSLKRPTIVFSIF